MSVLSEPWATPVASSVTKKQRRIELMRSVRSLFFTGDFSDCTITCGNYELHMHKNIICSRSTTFKILFTSGGEEEQTGVANLGDEDPEAVRSMLYYMYHLDYPCKDDSGLVKVPNDDSDDHAPGSPSSKSLSHSPDAHSDYFDPSAPNMAHHCRVYFLAAQYDVESLKALAAEKFEEESVNYWDHPAFIDAAREVYKNSPAHDLGLRSVVVGTIQAHHQLLDTTGIQKLLKESQLAFDLLMDSRKKGGLYQL